ncbi:MAG: hypothetical protein E6J79_16160 [Deltaproteobacteria bacterium]|nr:MAG: hypothetical protein E6J79_16160 [Deltaproteobacteria bacterium]
MRARRWPAERNRPARAVPSPRATVAGPRARSGGRSRARPARRRRGRPRERPARAGRCRPPGSRASA